MISEVDIDPHKAKLVPHKAKLFLCSHGVENYENSGP